MSKQSQALLILVSILILAMKDSVSLVHTILHCIPDNPWHHHEEIRAHEHAIPTFDIHKYLQHKHSHTHHAYTHTHDIMDHIHADENGSESPSQPEKASLTLKLDYYFQSLSGFHFIHHSTPATINHFSFYLGCIRNGYTSLSCKPPQV